MRLKLASLFAILHTLLFGAVTIAVMQSEDPEAGMAYYLFFFLDSPISVFFESAYSISFFIPVLGGLLWFFYGWCLQNGVHEILGFIQSHKKRDD